MRILSIAAVFIAVAFPVALACSPDQFEISGLHSRVDSGYTIITGQVKNNCADAAAVWLKATVFGKDGDVLDTDEFMPSSTRNIAAGASYSFKTMFHLDEKAQRYNVTPAQGLTSRPPFHGGSLSDGC